MAKLILVLCVLLGLVACKQDKTTKTPTKTPAKAAEAASATPLKQLKTALEKKDLSCKQDSDCALNSRYIENDQCCTSCSPTAVNTAWSDKVDKLCTTVGRKGCKMRKCKWPKGAKCENNKCVIIKE